MAGSSVVAVEHDPYWIFFESVIVSGSECSHITSKIFVPNSNSNVFVATGIVGLPS